MATERQTEANRLNAQKSTGPRTPEGKAASSQNAFKSGLDAESQFVYGEDRADFALLQHEYFERFQPASPEERFQVDTLIRNEWLLRRLFRAEAHLWEYQVIGASRSEGVPLGEGFAKSSNVFMRLQRRVTLCEKSYKDAFTELQRLQAARQVTPPPPQPEASPQPQPTKAPSPKLASFRTFSPEPSKPSAPANGSPAAAPAPAPGPPNRGSSIL